MKLNCHLILWKISRLADDYLSIEAGRPSMATMMTFKSLTMTELSRTAQLLRFLTAWTLIASCRTKARARKERVDPVQSLELPLPELALDPSPKAVLELMLSIVASEVSGSLITLMRIPADHLIMGLANRSIWWAKMMTLPSLPQAFIATWASSDHYIAEAPPSTRSFPSESTIADLNVVSTTVNK
jgi:hypothetical protein